MATPQDIDAIVRILKREVRAWELPLVTKMAKHKQDPFKILISTILSARTKDEVTAGATERLFSLADSPEEMAALALDAIAEAVSPVGFYRTKARYIRESCEALIERHGSRVPDSMEALVALPGVGRKTANLVMTQGFRKPGICVDTHVHRITNRLGLVSTKHPEETERVLRRILPRKHWIIYNDLLVAYGQHLCRPISPMCSRCEIERYCSKVGVTKHR